MSLDPGIAVTEIKNNSSYQDSRLEGSLNSIIWTTTCRLLKVEKTVAPRGCETKEILGYSFKMDDIRDRLCTLKGRLWDPSFCVAEWLWYLRGSRSLPEISFWSKMMNIFSDDQKTLHGAYGFRVFCLYNSFEAALKKLRTDPDSRQAVVPIFEPRDTFQLTKDLPCTLLWHFMVRDGKLDMFVDMRSNDVLTGTTNDVFAFTMIQEWAARKLGLEPGTYHHYAHSMHLYTDKITKVGNWAGVEDSKHAWVPVSTMRPMPYQAVAENVQNYLDDQVASLQNYEDKIREKALIADVDFFENELVKEYLFQDIWTQDMALLLLAGAAFRTMGDEDQKTRLNNVVLGSVSSLNDPALRVAMLEKYGRV